MALEFVVEITADDGSNRRVEIPNLDSQTGIDMWRAFRTFLSDSGRASDPVVGAAIIEIDNLVANASATKALISQPLTRQSAQSGRALQAFARLAADIEDQTRMGFIDWIRDTAYASMPIDIVESDGNFGRFAVPYLAVKQGHLAWRTLKQSLMKDGNLPQAKMLSAIEKFERLATDTSDLSKSLTILHSPNERTKDALQSLAQILWEAENNKWLTFVKSLHVDGPK